MRALAQRSAEAAKQIKGLITRSGEEVETGVTLVGDTGVALQTIIGDVKEISDHVIAIVDASREQSISLAEINTAVGTIDQGTQQNAAIVEETSAASQNLASEAEQLNELLGGFQLGGAPAESPAEDMRQAASAPPRFPARNPGPRPAVHAAARAVRPAAYGSAALAQSASATQDDGWEEF